MELWEHAEECCDRATETEDVDKAVELLDMAIVLYLQAAEGAETEESMSIRTKDARMAEGKKVSVTCKQYYCRCTIWQRTGGIFQGSCKLLTPCTRINCGGGRNL
ncbi:MAG: hypothetical protein U9Q68_11345 [Euryarchaeota archaeon]|nr:hypothetical protein [Euryarchaeota archaeon]